MVNSGLSVQFFNVLHIPIILGLALAAIGGSDASKGDLNKQQTGHTLSKVAVVVFVIVWIIQSGIAILTCTKLHDVASGDRRLAFAILASVPFLFVRLLYSILAAFDTSTSTFSPSEGSVVVQAVMAVIEEFVVVILYLGAGFLVPVVDAKNNMALAGGWTVNPNGQETYLEAR
jgi:hypothetical protein